MINIIDLFPALAAATVTILICFVVYKAIAGNQTATIILTAIVSFLILIGAAAAGTAETQKGYFLELCVINITNEEITVIRLSDGNEYVIDYEAGWVNGLNPVVFNNNGTTQPYDDIVIVRNELVNDFIHKNI